MKKLIRVTIAIMIILSLIGCSGNATTTVTPTPTTPEPRIINFGITFDEFMNRAKKGYPNMTIGRVQPFTHGGNSYTLRHISNPVDMSTIPEAQALLDEMFPLVESFRGMVVTDEQDMVVRIDVLTSGHQTAFLLMMLPVMAGSTLTEENHAVFLLIAQSYPIQSAINLLDPSEDYLYISDATESIVFRVAEEYDNLLKSSSDSPIMLNEMEIWCYANNVEYLGYMDIAGQQYAIIPKGGTLIPLPGLPDEKDEWVTATPGDQRSTMYTPVGTSGDWYYIGYYTGDGETLDVSRGRNAFQYALSSSHHRLQIDESRNEFVNPGAVPFEWKYIPEEDIYCAYYYDRFNGNEIFQYYKFIDGSAFDLLMDVTKYYDKDVSDVGEVYTRFQSEDDKSSFLESLKERHVTYAQTAQVLADDGSNYSLAGRWDLYGTCKWEGNVDPRKPISEEILSRYNGENYFLEFTSTELCYNAIGRSYPWYQRASNGDIWWIDLGFDEEGYTWIRYIDSNTLHGAKRNSDGKVDIHIFKRTDFVVGDDFEYDEDEDYMGDSYLLEDLILEGKSRYYTEEDIMWYGADDLRLLRNGMFALSGKIFRDPELSQFFLATGWYSPETEDDKIVTANFNKYQKANLELITKMEKELGYR